MKTRGIRGMKGFTIIEVLLVITVISLIGSATYYTVASSQETARERKLESDVAALNSAAQVYLANGGNLPDDLTADEALAKLKTRADASSEAQAVGLKGSMVDARIESVWQSSDEAGQTGKLRALWNGEQKRFELARSGELGIKRFELNAELAGEAPDVESREHTLVAATETQWVWDYANPSQTPTPSSGSRLGALPGSPTPTPNPSATPTATPDQNPVQLDIELVVAYTTMTYQQAGGQMTEAPSPPAPVTVNLLSVAQIPPAYLKSEKFQIQYSTDGSDPLTPPFTKGPDFNGSFVSPQMDVSVSSWGMNTTRTFKAVAVALDTEFFASSSVKTQTITKELTDLTSPVIDPPSGGKAADLPVSIALASGSIYPAGARIYYTLDGTDPGNNGGEPTGGELYEAQFNAGTGVDGIVTVTARVYGPAGYGHWFTPSPVAVATYATVTLADGALVGSATLNGTFVGSLVYASPAAGGSMNNITFNSNARIISGNLYLPGTPTIRRTNGTVWSAATDSAFSGIIQGWEYNNHVKTVQTTPRVLNENGSATPDNYTVTFNNSALLEGKVIRRHDSPAFPTIAPPPAPDSGGSTSLSSAPAGPLSASTYSTVTLNSAPVGDVRLLPGNYQNLTANNGTSFVLGDPDNPEVTQYYTWQSLTLNSGSDVKIVGKVIITVSNSINLNSNSVLGNVDHPEWLQLQFSSGDMNANSGSTIYAQLVAPNSSVTFNAGSTFNGSVTAKNLTVNSDGVIFTLPPVIAN